MIMKKKKSALILLIMLVITLTPLKIIQAHNVQLDPKNLISMPEDIIDGNATVSIKESITDYTLYFQAVKIDSSVASQIKEFILINDNKINTLYEKYITTKNEVTNLNIEKNKYYNKLLDESLSEEQKQELETAYNTA